MKSNVMHLETIAEMHKLLPNAAVKHPLVSVVDFENYQEQFNSGMKITLGFYSIMFKNSCINKVKYGQNQYDFQDGSLICIAPRQVITLDEPVANINKNVAGWGLFFHPDIIRGTSLSKRIRDYTFFDYTIHEALHLSEKEKQILADLIRKIECELDENIDEHSQTLIASSIELLLNYCTRYYDRQFITRKNSNNEVLTTVDDFLSKYFQSNKSEKDGIPTVKILADMVFLSPNYLSDLLKRETGMNAQDRIHYFLIEEAKNLLLSSELTIGELAFSLGFEYPQYFSRLFKSKTGLTPLEFRNLN